MGDWDVVKNNSASTESSSVGDWDVVGPQPAIDTTEDVIKSGATGVGRGVIGLAGMPGDIAGLAAQGLGWATGTEPESWRDKDAKLPSSEQLQKKTEEYTGKFYEPKTTAGKYAQSVGEFAPAVVGGPETLAARLATRVALPAVASEAAGELAEKVDPKAAPWARAAAAIVSPVAARRIFAPARAFTQRERALTTLQNEGVDVSGGQATGNPRLRYAESELGGPSADALMERQGEQFTSAAMRRIGEPDVPYATPEVMDNAFNRIGGQFDQLAARNTLVPDNRMFAELGNARNNYNRLVAPNQRVPAVQDAIDDIVHQIVGSPGGQLPGDIYQAMRSRLAADARVAASDPHLQHTLYDITGALDNAMERTLTRLNPQDLGAWQEARRQYRNMMVIERAVGYAGEASAAGRITPANLGRAVVSLHGLRNYVRGRGDFAELARAGREVLAPMPQSGTTPRLMARAIPAVVGATVGSLAGLGTGPAIGAGIGALAGHATSRGLGAAMLSRPGRAYLGQQIPGQRAAANFLGQANPYRNALVRGVLANPGGMAGGFKKGGRVLKSFTTS